MSHDSGKELRINNPEPIEREILRLSVGDARDAISDSLEGFRLIEDVLYDTSRWSEHYRLTIKRKSDEKFFQSTYSVGATESQDERPFEYTEPIFKEVFPVQKIVTVYE
jgi:hypothetical protein